MLGLLLLIGGTRGEMPRWAAILAGFLFRSASAATRAAEWASQKQDDEDKFLQLTPDSSLQNYLDALYFPYPYPAGTAAMSKRWPVRAR